MSFRDWLHAMLTHQHDGEDGTVNIPQGSVTGLTTALAGKAASSHTHAQSDITGLVSALAGKANAFTGYTGEIFIVDANATSFSHRLTFSNGILTAYEYISA